MNFTYAIINHVIGVVDDVGDVINVIGMRDGNSVIVLATTLEDFLRFVIDKEVVVIVYERKDYVKSTSIS